jgi:hypothetical protein
LTDEQWEKLTTTLAASPSAVDYDVPAWTPELVHDYIKTAFEIDYYFGGWDQPSKKPEFKATDPPENGRFSGNDERVINSKRGFSVRRSPSQQTGSVTIIDALRRPTAIPVR